MNLSNFKDVSELVYGKHFNLGGSASTNEGKNDLENELNVDFEKLINNYKNKYRQESNIILVRYKYYNKFTKGFYEKYELKSYKKFIWDLVSKNTHVFKLLGSNNDVLSYLISEKVVNGLVSCYFVKDSVLKSLLNDNKNIKSASDIVLSDDMIDNLCMKLNILKN